MTYQTDQHLSIGAARQAQIPAATATPPIEAHAQKTHRPRKLLPFDLIKGLHDIAFDRLGHRHAYNHCIVQKERDGSVSARLDLDAMQMARSTADITYAQLTKYTIEEAERMAVRVREMDPEVRFETLNRLVKLSATDGQIAWVLSTACLRRLLFPASYLDKRCDNVRYSFRDKDSMCGLPMDLKSLSAGNVSHFLHHATRICPSLPVTTITPITVATTP